MLQAWTHSGALQEQVANKMQEWFESGLQQWDTFPRRAVFWFRNKDAPGKIFLRLAGRADWLYGLLQKICAISAVTRPVLMRITGKRLRRRTVPLYRLKTSSISTACSGLPC